MNRVRVGVQQAQEFGVRVHLVGIKPARGTQSLFLLQEADTTHEWVEAEVSTFLACKPKIALGAPSALPAIVASAGGGAVDPLDVVASSVAASVEKTEVSALVAAFDKTTQLPRDVDRQLLSSGRSSIGRDLEPSEKKRVRLAFVERCRRRLTSGV